MLAAQDYPLLNIVLTMFWFFLFVIWLMLLISVFGDIFGRKDLSGWGKAAWTLGIIFFPLIGVLLYLITRPHPTEEEIAGWMAGRQPKVDIASELAKLAELHEKGALTDAEFAQLKEKLLAQA